MSTKSFVDTYVIECEDVDKFRDIMKNNEKLRINHNVSNKDIKGKDILIMLGIDKDKQKT